jgi:hypothetical protein
MIAALDRFTRGVLNLVDPYENDHPQAPKPDVWPYLKATLYPMRKTRLRAANGLYSTYRSRQSGGFFGADEPSN